MRKLFWPIVVAIAALVLIFGGALVALSTDWLWFSDLGYGAVFLTKLLTQIKIGLLFGFLFFAVVYGNLWYARRIAPPPTRAGLEQQLLERLGNLARRGFGLLLFLGSIVLAAMVGLEAATHWEEWLKYSNTTAFGAADPLFHRDIGFYVFQLPFLNYLYYWLFVTLAAATVASAGLHYADEAIEVFGNRLQFAPKVKPHLAVLIAAMFFLKAWGYRLAMYDLLFTHSALFDGAGYTEVHANLPALWIMMVIAIIGGVLVLLNAYRRGIAFAAAGLIVLVGASILIGAGYPATVQQFIVGPNELEKQRPYIKLAIKATQEAYALSTVGARQFEAEPSLGADQVDANRATIENIRLWDREHLQAAYNQIQTIQQYYHFQDLDVDRYWLKDRATGELRYRQVWLSARELDESRLPENSRTWINQHLQYTHGYGYAMSPVNETDSEGLPRFFVQNIPPVTTVDIPIHRMGVYFGELTDNYVFVKTSSQEFDYPSGGEQKPTAYSGSGGVRVGGFLRKALFALRFSDMNILLNANIKPDSRVLFRRNISERIETLLPFLQFDSDPYLVTVNGDLYYIRDGYTVTDAYPYSRRPAVGAPYNYIRNSVKVVVNAYTGKMDAYVTEKPLPDPIIRTYQKMFKGVFKPISAMPSELLAHVRYPEDMFSIQAMIYSRYHYSADSQDSFYRDSDRWEIPGKANLTVGTANTESQELMEPYYVIMKLPGGKSEEFILMTPYIRAGGRKNMVAWMCAKCDAADYGRLVLYQFPEDKNVYGPQQIAGRASQDTVISPQLSLWNQQGSTVGSGNMLVIPIESSLLYVMPVYLVSTGTQIPELKRVIVAFGDHIAMEPTLGEALARVVGAPVSVPQPMAGAAKPAAAGKQIAPGKPVGDMKKLIDQASSQYEKAQSAQRSGDWAEYGRQVEALKRTLEELRSKAR